MTLSSELLCLVWTSSSIQGAESTRALPSTGITHAKGQRAATGGVKTGTGWLWHAGSHALLAGFVQVTGAQLQCAGSKHSAIMRCWVRFEPVSGASKNSRMNGFMQDRIHQTEVKAMAHRSRATWLASPACISSQTFCSFLIHYLSHSIPFDPMTVAKWNGGAVRPFRSHGSMLNPEDIAR